MYRQDSVSITGVSEPEQVNGLNVTHETLPILGVVPVAGRIFTQEDDSPSAPETIVISNGYWHKRFGGDSSAIGRTLIVDGTPRQIIGVLPQKFQFLDQPDPAIVMPFRFDRSKTFLGSFSCEALARL